MSLSSLNLSYKVDLVSTAYYTPHYPLLFGSSFPWLPHIIGLFPRTLVDKFQAHLLPRSLLSLGLWACTTFCLSYSPPLSSFLTWLFSEKMWLSARKLLCFMSYVIFPFYCTWTTISSLPVQGSASSSEISISENREIVVFFHNCKATCLVPSPAHNTQWIFASWTGKNVFILCRVKLGEVVVVGHWEQRWFYFSIHAVVPVPPYSLGKLKTYWFLHICESLSVIFLFTRAALDIHLNQLDY